MVEKSQQMKKRGDSPKNGTHEARLLALEIRPSKAGFAVFEGATLLDWGVMSYGLPPSATRKIGSLIDLYTPSIITFRRQASAERHRSIAGIVELIKRRAKGGSIRIQTLDAYQVRAFFTARARRSKHEIALLLAEWFPELAWKIPPKRKPWQSEPYNTPLFDAVATAATFLTAQP